MLFDESLAPLGWAGILVSVAGLVCQEGVKRLCYPATRADKEHF